MDSICHTRTVFWDEMVVPELRNKKKIMIVGHENNLRSIIKLLDYISDTGTHQSTM